MLPEKAMAPHSSTLAWKIPWAEEPGGLQSMGSRRVGHDWATSLSLFTFHFSLSCTGEGHGNPLQCSCLENPRDGGAWWAAVYGVTQSWTRLKWLSILTFLQAHQLFPWLCSDYWWTYQRQRHSVVVFLTASISFDAFLEIPFIYLYYSPILALLVHFFY